MSKISDKYEITEKEMSFLDSLAKEMSANMPNHIKEQLRGSKEHLRDKLTRILEDIITEIAEQPGMERVATTERVKKYSKYMADKLYERVNRR